MLEMFALLRAKSHGLCLSLGEATPSIEHGRELRKGFFLRVDTKGLIYAKIPQVKVVDFKDFIEPSRRR